MKSNIKDKIYEYLMDKVGLEGQREIELKFAVYTDQLEHAARSIRADLPLF